LKKRQAVFIHSRQLEKYKYPPECPFKTERAAKTCRILNTMGLLAGEGKKQVFPEPAQRDILKTFHTAKYLNALKSSEKGNWDIESMKMGIGTPDVPVFRGMYDYAVLACGGTIKAAQMLLCGEAEIAFNPSGGYHHAGPELAAGFCYINDTAIVCKYLADKGKKVLYLDIDVHHGDGVQTAFYDRNDVMTISLHESGKLLFPGTGFEDEIGEGEGKGFCVNIPLPTGTYDSAYLEVFYKVVKPLIKAYNADIIVLEAGGDVLAGDPLAHLKLTNNIYPEILDFLLRQNKPILIEGGGGYNVENTVRAWCLIWSIVTGEQQGFSDMNLGLGGVMLESTDWLGGFKDRKRPVTKQQQKVVAPAIKSSIEKIKKTVFPVHHIKQ
jgi:acetoin utilization protein AcuC